jgi:hypothetical protein
MDIQARHSESSESVEEEAANYSAMMADGDNHREKRYYDRDGRDYHTWNNNEDRAYRQYLEEQHREYRVFPKVRAPQQREYFRWRHEHPDNTLFKVEIR